MKATLQNHQSSLAKLLAKENLTIQHGNFQTAFFDVKNRVLGLPVWKDKGKDVYDLLVGHEVGHALYTPSWEPTTFPCPSVYVNVVEDVRIERMIQSTYPGLVACFRRGYSVLLKDNFFGTNGKDLSKMGLADRLNLKAKLGTLLEVPFLPNEKPIIDQVYAAETWEEVLAASKALYDFCKEQANKPKQSKNQKKEKSPSPADEDQGDGDGSSNDKNEENQKPQDNKSQANASDDSDDDEGDESNKADPSLESTGDDEEGSSSDESEEADDSKTPGSSKGSTNDEEEDSESDAVDEDDFESFAGEGAGREVQASIIEPTVETAENFEREAKKLVDDSSSTRRTAQVREHSRQDWEKVIVRFEDVFKYRDAHSDYRALVSQVSKTEEFKHFYKKSKKYIMVLVKEFELRKAAFQYSRATTSRTGTLDVNKLHSYRTNDDIFLSISNLADAKNHGLVMVVDFSGSMSSSLKNILHHTIQLSMFCRQVGIPFEVYSFTDGVGRPGENYHQQTVLEDSKVLLGSLLMNELVSSRMSKVQFDRALRDLYLRGSSYYDFPGNEGLGGTPLVEAIMISHYLVNDFRIRNRVQKMTTMLLTDGAGGTITLSNDHTYDAYRQKQPNYGYWNYNFNILGHKFTSQHNSASMTTAMINSLREVTGSKVLGFFIPSNTANAGKHVDLAVDSIPSNKLTGNKRKYWNNGLRDLYKQDNSVCIDNAFGYDKYFVVSPGEDLSVDDDGFSFSGGGRQSLAKAFTEYSTSRKTNKVFLTKFAEAIS